MGILPEDADILPPSDGDLYSSQPSSGIRRYDRLARTYQVTFYNYTIFPGRYFSAMPT